MDLDSALLRAFVTVVEEQHFGRAAVRLFITQQALSKRVTRLEGLLGVRLLDRGPRSTLLTTAGERLLPVARDAVDAVDAAVDSVLRAGTLAIDVLDEHLCMLPAVRALNNDSTDLTLSVVTRADTASALDTLRSGAADLVLGRPGPMETPWPSDVRGAAIHQEQIQLLVPHGYLLNRESGGTPVGRKGEATSTISMTDLARHRLWFPTVGAPREYSELLTEMADTFGLDIDDRGSTFGFDYWLSLVADGKAPPSLIGSTMELPPGLAVTAVPIIEPTPVFWWWGMWRRRSAPSIIEGIVTHLAQQLKGEPPRGSIWLPHADRQFVRMTPAQSAD